MGLRHEFASGLAAVDPQQPSQHEKQHEQNAPNLESIPPQRRKRYDDGPAKVEHDEGNDGQQSRDQRSDPAVELKMAATDGATKKSAPPGIEKRSPKAQGNGADWASVHISLSGKAASASFILKLCKAFSRPAPPLLFLPFRCVTLQQDPGINAAAATESLSVGYNIPLRRYSKRGK